MMMTVNYPYYTICVRITHTRACDTFKWVSARGRITYGGLRTDATCLRCACTIRKPSVWNACASHVESLSCLREYVFFNYKCESAARCLLNSCTHSDGGECVRA